jgi:hypothetical protein
VSPGFAGCQVPGNRLYRTGESSARRRTALLKKEPAIELAPPLYPPIVVRAGDEPNSIIVENFPQPIEREYAFTIKVPKP